MNTDDYDDADFASERAPSKSQLKRDMTALQDIGEQLLKLSRKQLTAIPVPEELIAAIELAKSLHQREALRRQRQYIGRLMRDIDVIPITSYLNERHSQHKKPVDAFHHIEHWRDRLLTEGATALTEFINTYPSTDTQQLNQLIRNALREQQQGKPLGSTKLLFKFLQTLIKE